MRALIDKGKTSRKITFLKMSQAHFRTFDFQHLILYQIVLLHELPSQADGGTLGLKEPEQLVPPGYLRGYLLLSRFP